jgi:predicted nucleic acid-binding protein
MLFLPILSLAFFLGGAGQDVAQAQLAFPRGSEIQPVTPGVARLYGRLFADLRRAGTPIPINDVWIAATTLVAADIF